jgi:diguanylate cyclase (GGDEF)-like protein/PAS domain S-box-containing protein
MTHLKMPNTILWALYVLFALVLNAVPPDSHAAEQAADVEVAAEPPATGITASSSRHEPPTADDRQRPAAYISAPLLVGLGLGALIALPFGWRAKAQATRVAKVERVARALGAATPNMVTIQSADGAISYASPAAMDLTGYGPDQLLGVLLSNLVHPSDAAELEILVREAAQADSTRRANLRLECKDGHYRSFQCSVEVLGPESDSDYAFVAAAVTATARVEEELETIRARYQMVVYQDAHTGLPNRDGTFLRLSRMLRTAEQEQRSVAVLLVNIDNFKAVNSSLGLEAADRLIGKVAKRLEGLAGEHELGRLIGDEFVVIVPNAESNLLTALADRLVESLSQPIVLGGERVYLTASVGLSRYPSDGTDAHGLLSAASVALQAAKASGKNTWRSYNEEIGRAASLRAMSLKNLRDIYGRNEFLLYYQPKVSLNTGARRGYEALLRWKSPEGIRSAVELVAAAEQSGFIDTLGEWVLRSASRQSRAWRLAGHTLPIAVNVSACQFQSPGFLHLVREMVREDPELPKFLVIELTESTLAKDLDVATASLREITMMGFKVHIDDFGTGYSSLSRLSLLAQMPIDTVKIDCSFIQEVPNSESACELVKGIIALAHALRMNVVAEGVQTKQQATFLWEAGCNEAQGYLYGPPSAAQEIGEALGIEQRISEDLAVAA